MIRGEISEYPYQGKVFRLDDEDNEVVVYDGVMDEHMVTDDEGRVLQTSSYIISMPLVESMDGHYNIPRKDDTIRLLRYGEWLEFTVDNAEPSQLGGISVYCTKKDW